MHVPKPYVLVFVTVLATAVSAAASRAKGFVPDPKDFHSQSLEITLGSVMATTDSRPQLMLNLTNKTDRTLWLGVRFAPPAPNPGCEETKRVESKREASFACAQNALVPDADYPIAIAVFGDSALTDTVENNSTRMRFGKKDVKLLGEWLEATRLPKTYEHIILKEKLGLGAALFGSLGEGGTLVVKPDGLEHVTKKRNVTVSAAQLRGVSVRRLGQRASDAWVVVDYDDAGSAKTLAFQAAAFKGEGPEILDKVNASIQALLEHREKKE